MDLSKLPRLSETDKHTPPPSPDQVERSLPPSEPMRVQPAPAAGAEAWFSVAIGLIVQLMNTRFWSFIISKLSGREYTWTFTAADGSAIGYTQTVFFAGDLAMVLFGLVLMLEGAVLVFTQRRPVVMVVLTLTVLTAGFNLVYLIWMMNAGYGLQLMAALAAIFGVYIAMYQWRILKGIPLRA